VRLHALRLVAVDDRLLLARGVTRTANQIGQSARERSIARAKRLQIAPLGDVDILDLLGVDADRMRGVVGVGAHLDRMLLAHPVGLAPMLVDLVGLMALLPLLDEGFGALTGFVAAGLVTLLNVTLGGFAALCVKLLLGGDAVLGLAVGGHSVGCYLNNAKDEQMRTLLSTVAKSAT